MMGYRYKLLPLRHFEYQRGNQYKQLNSPEIEIFIQLMIYQNSRDKKRIPTYNIWICIVKIVFEISMSMSLMCIFSLQCSSTYDRVCVGRTRDAVVEFAIDKGASWA